jgi:type IV secretion system protein TrbL
MVWTFGMLALRKADIGEFYAEFVRFTIFTGFFWWLLTNGPNFATDIMNSLRTARRQRQRPGAGAVALGHRRYWLRDLLQGARSVLGVVAGRQRGRHPHQRVAILIILALIGVNMLLLLASGWVLAYGGVFFLGFGGSRWTSDMAINYYKTVLGVAAQLFTMVLLVGIGKTFVDQYYARMSAGHQPQGNGRDADRRMVLLALVNKLPALIGGLAMGGGVHTMGSGFGTGAAMGRRPWRAQPSPRAGAAIAAGAANGWRRASPDGGVLQGVAGRGRW